MKQYIIHYKKHGVGYAFYEQLVCCTLEELETVAKAIVAGKYGTIENTMCTYRSGEWGDKEAGKIW